MYLAVFDLIDAAPEQLARWTSDPECVPILTRPILSAPIEAWRRPPIELHGFEEEGYKYVQVFRPVFDAGQEDAGPRSPQAVIGVAAMLDYWLFCQTRFDWTLLREMHTACGGVMPQRIELITDRWDGGAATRPTQAASEGWKIPWKSTFFTERTSTMQRFRRAVRRVTRSTYPPAQTMVQCLEDRARRRRALADTPGNGSGAALAEFVRRSTRANVRAAMAVYQQKSWRYLLPIYEELIRQDQAALFISTRSTTEVPLREANLPYIANTHTWAEPRLVRNVRSFFGELPLDESAAARVGAAELIAPLHCVLRDAAGELTNFYADFGRLMPETFRRYRINAVLGTDSGSGAGRALFRIAEKMGINSYFVQHGIFGDLPGQADYFTDSKILLWGKSSRDSLIRSGLPKPENIFAFGSPFLEEQFDAVGKSEITDDEQSDIITAFGIPSDICSEVSFRIAAEEIVRAARELPHRKFLVKLHPGDHSGIFLRLAEQNSLPNLRVTKAGDIYRMIAGSRIVLTQFSTSGSEAIHMGRPVVAVLLDGADWRIDFLVEEAAYVVRQAGELTPLLEQLLSSAPEEHRLAGRQRQFARDFLHRENESAATRLVRRLADSVSIGTVDRARAETETPHP